MSTEELTSPPAETTPAAFASVTLGDAFGTALPELALRWESAAPEHPSLVVLNEGLANELGLDSDLLRSEAGIRFLIGNALAEGSNPAAQVYAGHQFGGYAPRLGDGRALLLGELQTPAGAVVDLHLKGSGRTPFSRGGDGFAAVGPMLREYLMSEAMHALGVPTTRSLAVVGTGRWVPRDEVLPGAVLTRVASSHLRVGSFQYARSTGDLGLLDRLTHHAIARHYPELEAAENPPLRLLEAVIEAQAQLTAKWMLVGFVHGVMNTDNVTLSGETIDYGPCAFIDEFDSAAVFSSIDQDGRYAYGRQPSITQWNLTRFAEALLPLLSEDEEVARALAIGALSGYEASFDATSRDGMRAKIGLESSDVSDETVASLASEILGALQQERVDYTMFFRALAGAARGDDTELMGLFTEPKLIGAWYGAWLAFAPDGDAMDRVNPVYIPRNHLVDSALDAASNGELALFDELLAAVSRPFEARPGLERFSIPAPAGSRPFVTTCGT